MDSHATSKTYPSVVASGNAILHLGDVIYVSPEGEQAERIALSHMIERLDRIVNNDRLIGHIDDRRNHDLQLAGYKSSHSSSSIEDSTTTYTPSPSGHIHLYQSQVSKNIPHPTEVLYREPIHDKHGRFFITRSPNEPKIRHRKNTELKVFAKELIIGKLILRRYLQHESTRAHGGLASSRSYQLSAHFVPKSWFSQKVIRLGLTWSVFGHEISNISLNPSFTDIVPDNHPMILCAATGDVNGLRALLMLENGPRPSCTTWEGWSPLHFAAAAGHYEVCDLLLCHGASPNATGDSNINPLHVSANFGELGVFRRLLSAGGDLDNPHDHGTNPLFDLLAHQSLFKFDEFHDLIHWLIRGQDCYLIDVEHTDNGGRSILNYLMGMLQAVSDDKTDSRIADRCVQSIHSMISSGVNLSARDAYGKTLLHIACENRQLNVIQMLLDRGCSIDVRDVNDYTLLHNAVLSQDCELAAFLIQYGAEVELFASPGSEFLYAHQGIRYAYTTLLSLVALLGNTEMFAIILDQMVRTEKVKSLNADHLTEILSLATHNSNPDFMEMLIPFHPSKACLSAVLTNTFDVEMIEILVRAGACPDGGTGYTTTPRWKPLPRAAMQGELNAVKKLLDLGADVDGAEPDGRSALHFAAVDGDEELVDILLLHGADREVRTETGLSPAEIAMSHGFTDLALKLSDNPPQIQSNDLSLINACQANDVELARGLIKAGAPLENGVLECAISWKSYEVAELLINAGSSVQRSLVLVRVVKHVNFSDYVKESAPLLEVARFCNNTLTQLMIEKGADINEVLEKNNTPLLHVLDGYQCKEPLESRTCFVRTLLEAGIRVDVRDVFGRTPLGKASQIGALEIVQLLIKAGADVNEICTLNTDDTPYEHSVHQIAPRSPLAWAALNGHKDVVKTLYEAGAQWKSLKKDPAVSHIHNFLMRSWFIVSVRSKISGGGGSTSVGICSDFGSPGSEGGRTTRQRADENSACKKITITNHAGDMDDALGSRHKSQWTKEVLLERPARLVNSTLCQVGLELIVFIVVTLLVSVRWVGKYLIRTVQAWISD